MALSIASDLAWLRPQQASPVWQQRPVIELVLDRDDFGSVTREEAEHLFEGVGTPQVVVDGDIDMGEASLPAWFAAAAVRTQAACGLAVEFAGCRPGRHPNEWVVAFEYADESLGAAAAEFVLRWLDSLVQGRPLDLDAEWNAWRNTVSELTGKFAAEPRPAQKSWGVDRLDLRAQLIERGLPVPLGREVLDVEDACVAAHRFGWPVLVRPARQRLDRSLVLQASNQTELRAAYEAVARRASRVVVESRVPGTRFVARVEQGQVESLEQVDGDERISVDLANAHPQVIQAIADAAGCLAGDRADVWLALESPELGPHWQSLVVLEVEPLGEVAENHSADRVRAGRRPVVAVVAEARDSREAERIADQLGRGGRTVGLASRGGAWLGGRGVGPSVESVGEHLRRLARHPRVDLLVVQLSPEDLQREGVPFEWCDALIDARGYGAEACDSSVASVCERLIHYPASLHHDQLARFRSE